MSDLTLASGKRPRHVRAHKNLDARLRKSQRADGSWVYEIRRDVYDADTGKRRRAFETVGTRLDQAKARLAEITTADAKGEKVSAIGMRVAEAVDGWRQVREIRPRTVEGYERNLRLYVLPRFGRMRVRDIDTQDVRAWLNAIQRKDGRPGELAGGTKRLILEVFAVVLDYAVEKGAITVNPARSLKRKAKPKQTALADRILSPAEEDRLLAACGNFPWIVPIVEVALLGALRMGEVLALRWRDVDFEACTIHVRESFGKDGRFGPPKGGPAVIDLIPPMRKVLAELATLEASPDDLLFTNTTGGPRHPRDVGRAFSKARRYAKLATEPRPLRFHDLRHTCASRLANAPGANPKTVQRYLRHADLTTTLGYVHEIRDTVREQAMWEAVRAS